MDQTMGTLYTLHFMLILTEIIAISDIGIATITSLVKTSYVRQ